MLKVLFAPVYAKADLHSPLLTKLVIGTRVCLNQELSKEANSFVQILLPDKQIAYIQNGHIVSWEKSAADEEIFEKKWQQSSESERQRLIADLGKQTIQIAKLFMGTPYLWGGSTPFGMDCSGMTQLAYKLHGVELLRNSYMQYDDKRFEKIEKDKALDKAEWQAGDLLFFDIKQKGKIDHVGIACGEGTFIQARGEMMDGGMVITNCADDYYKQVYTGACRISTNANINISAS